jgi:hypothetical protein
MGEQRDDEERAAVGAAARDRDHRRGDEVRSLVL